MTVKRIKVYIVESENGVEDVYCLDNGIIVDYSVIYAPHSPDQEELFTRNNFPGTWHYAEIKKIVEGHLDITATEENVFAIMEQADPYVFERPIIDGNDILLRVIELMV